MMNHRICTRDYLILDPDHLVRKIVIADLETNPMVLGLTLANYLLCIR